VGEVRLRHGAVLAIVPETRIVTVIFVQDMSAIQAGALLGRKLLGEVLFARLIHARITYASHLWLLQAAALSILQPLPPKPVTYQGARE
jgi:hypothetical protein